MNLAKNRSLRNWKILRSFVSDTRELAIQRRKIRNIITSACDKVNIPITKAFRKRARRIANFVLEEDKSQRKSNLLMISFVVILFLSVFFIIPKVIYEQNSNYISSAWTFYFSYLGAHVVSGIIISLLGFVWSFIIGKDIEKDDVFSPIMAVFSIMSLITLVLSQVGSKITFPSWMIALLWSHSFNAVSLYLILPAFIKITNFLTKSSLRRHPYEKAIHLTARMCIYCKKYSRSNRLGNIYWRKKINNDLESLAEIFDSSFAKILNDSTKRTNKETKRRLSGISNYLRFLKQEVYFPNANTPKELDDKINLVFKALITGNFGEIPTLEESIKPITIKYILVNLIPSLILLLIWFVVYHYFKSYMPKEIVFGLMLLFISLPIGTVIQLFDKNFGVKLDWISKIKSINKPLTVDEN